MPELIDILRAAGVECYTREEWGSPREADGSYARRRGTHPMPEGPADFHFLHITVTPDSDLPADGKEAARKVEGYGLSTPPMVSYQDLVTNEGRYFEGQSYRVKGTHTVNDKQVPGFPRDLNLHGYATALMQDVGDEVTDDQVRLVAMIFAAREVLDLVRRGAPIYPHRFFDWKACPGDLAVARLPEIQRLRDEFVATGLPTLEDDVTPEDIEKVAKAVLKQPMKVKRAGTSVEISVEQVLRETFQRAERVDKDAIASAVFDRLVGGEMLAGHEVDFERVKQAVKDALSEGTG